MTVSSDVTLATSLPAGLKPVGNPTWGKGLRGIGAPRQGPESQDATRRHRYGAAAGWERELNSGGFRFKGRQDLSESTFP